MNNGLSLVHLRTLDLIPTLKTLLPALRGKPLDGLPNVLALDDLRWIRIRGHRPFPWQVDGDHLGDVDELVFRWEPSVLDLVVP